MMTLENNKMATMCRLLNDKVTFKIKLQPQGKEDGRFRENLDLFDDNLRWKYHFLPIPPFEHLLMMSKALKKTHRAAPLPGHKNLEARTRYWLHQHFIQNKL